MQEKRLESIVSPLKEILKDFEIRETKGRKASIGFGLSHYASFSQALSGFRKGALHLINGSSKRSRTQIMLELAISFIKTNRLPVLFVSYNSSPKDLIYQIVAREAMMNMETTLLRKVVGDSELKDKLKVGLERLAKYQSYLHLIAGSINDNPKSLENLVNEMRTNLKIKDLLLVVDTAQALSAQTQVSVESTIRSLKTLALNLDIPILLGSEISSSGLDLDEKEGRDRVSLIHAEGLMGDIEQIDFAISLTKNHFDSMELTKLLAKQAENMHKSQEHLPEIEVVDLILEKLMLGTALDYEAIQFLIVVENGKVLELGPRLNEDIQRFHRIEKSIISLIDRQEIEFKEIEEGASIPSLNIKEDTAIPSMNTTQASAPPKPRPKIALKRS